MSTENTTRHQDYRRYSRSIRQFYQTRKARAYTGIVLSIFTVAFFTFFTIRPTLVTIAGLLKEVEDKKIIAEKLEDKVSSLNSAQTEYQKFSDKFYLIDESLPPEANLSLFIRQLEALTINNGLAVNSLSFQSTTLKKPESTNKTDETEQAGKLRKISFSMTVNGNFQQVTTFVNNLFLFRRLISLDSYTISPSSGPEIEDSTLSINLKGAAYYLES